MDSKSEEEKMRAQTNQIFNMVERPVMQFISKFLDEPVGVIFKDKLIDQVDPLILRPIEEYDKDL